MAKIQLTFNTQNVNIAVALRALDNYRSGNYTEAITALNEVLDVEPNNWDARLMLGACFYKLDQQFSAQSAFRLICENATDPAVRNKAREGLIASGGKTGRRIEIPQEWGSCAVRQQFEVAWLD
jgi:Flp pilus assembly protein TadD